MIPIFAPVRQNEPFFPEIQARMNHILRSGEYILGPDVAQLEATLSEKLGYQHAVGCASGTEALVLAFHALGLQPGDEVITAAFSFVASGNSIAWAGLNPAFADVDLETANLTVESVAKALTPKTRAVLAVDLYGRQAPIAELRKFCDEKKLFLVEDGAQSIGVPNRGAHFYTTSFYPTKNVGCLGDAGAVMTDSPELATRVQEISRHGGLVRDFYPRVGTTGRMDTLQAAVLNLKMPHLEAWLQVRRSLAHWYRDQLQPLEDQGLIWLPRHPKEEKDHAWALYTVRIPKLRNDVLADLKARGIGAAVYYSRTLPQQDALKGFARGSYPNAERLANEVITLPLFPELTGKEFDFVIKQVRECLQKVLI